MQKKNFEDIIIGTGKSVTLKFILKYVFDYYNLNWKKHVKIKKKYIRLNDIKISKADNTKIKKKLNWRPKFYIEDVLHSLLKNKI